MLLQPKIFIVALCMSVTAACSTESSEQGYCGAGFEFEDEFARYESGESVGEARICVRADSTMESRQFTVNIGSVSGSLLIDGPALYSTLNFPALLKAENIGFQRCQLASANFPALRETSRLALACSKPDSPPFELYAPMLEAIPSLVVSGEMRLDLPSLVAIDDLEINGGATEDVFANVGGALRVGNVSVLTASLATLRLAAVTEIDTLFMAGTQSDLRTDAFPDLHRLRVLHINGFSQIRQCTLDAFLAQLDEPPESVILETTIEPCQ